MIYPFVQNELLSMGLSVVEDNFIANLTHRYFLWNNRGNAFDSTKTVFTLFDLNAPKTYIGSDAGSWKIGAGIREPLSS